MNQNIHYVIKKYSDLITYHKPHKSKKYYVESNPTIHYEIPDAFVLNSPSKPKVLPLACYCDRVEIDCNIKEDDLKEVLESMYANFISSEFNTLVDITDRSFLIPDMHNNTYFRELENGNLEIRLYAQGFKIIS